MATVAALHAAYAALQAVDRAQKQHYACMMDIWRPEFLDQDGRYVEAAHRAEREARAQMHAAQAAATAALAAVGVALEASPPPSGDLARLIAQEHETARALGCRHPDDEGER